MQAGPRRRDRPRRHSGEVIELEHGIIVYPAREEGGRWRAVRHEDGERQQCESRSEERLAVGVEKVTERVGASSMRRLGGDLIAWYLNPDRLPVDQRWSRKHAYTQRRLCERFAAGVIGTVICQDITAGHMQKIVNAAPRRDPFGRRRSSPGPGAGRRTARRPGRADGTGCCLQRPAVGRAGRPDRSAS